MKISNREKEPKSMPYSNKIGIFLASLLVTASAIYLYSPVIGSHADSNSSADINLSISNVLSLSLDKSALELGSHTNSFVSGDVDAIVSTNSEYGYTLTLEDMDSITSLVHTNENVDVAVTSDFSGQKTSSTMDKNTWGFSLDKTNFSRIPVNGSSAALKRTNVPMTAASETTTVTFGAKVGNLASGVYLDKVLFTAYVNGQPSEVMASLQNFDCTMLENVGDTDVLTDERDGNEYTIKKLADNKCWMMENLRISDTTITSADSHLPAGVSYTIPASSFTAGFGNDKTNGVYIDENNGGYYTYYTATAGWDTTGMSAGASYQDICPKGWRLPVAETFSSAYYNGPNAASDFPALYASYNNSASAMIEAGDFKRLGYMVGINEIYWEGIVGHYHTSSFYSTNYENLFSFSGTSNLSSLGNSGLYRFYGYPIRCVATNKD